MSLAAAKQAAAPRLYWPHSPGAPFGPQQQAQPRVTPRVPPVSALPHPRLRVWGMNDRQYPRTAPDAAVNSAEGAGGLHFRVRTVSNPNPPLCSPSPGGVILHPPDGVSRHHVASTSRTLWHKGQTGGAQHPAHSTNTGGGALAQSVAPSRPPPPLVSLPSGHQVHKNRALKAPEKILGCNVWPQS